MTYVAYYHSPVGILRLGGTEHYISEIYYLDALPPDARVHLNPLLQNCQEQLMEYFQGLRRTFDLPVHQEGSEFQQRVWGELMGIPYGRTITYMDLAKRVGDPKAVRAVGTTNGKNKIAIVLPCHRVIGARNDLVGYGGGLWRKRWLLEHENKIAHGVQTLF
ncbi:methylated-DNA--[protein]-cysteine S-methyltransferase [Dinghuibacter silviterrae]|uniref:Methylated-DNA--protein-cysteine methyltransferase n=1 Tax=Dinghuibacter silviterrae TaxID=1539049 RepID=A0A4R8DV04_9BACT|nr:methylated-DNA--[protein]-cysteine S-methyltransferase [Dinghuibacter silviterrae]TDX01748.1 methylated-DNA-[protein]-cysteine S-methyltransferase [Dinghuibacter silviterrae]